MCGKSLTFRGQLTLLSGYALEDGAQPQDFDAANRKATGLPHIRRQSRVQKNIGPMRFSLRAASVKIYSS
jgi:hypothetical protein